MSILPPAMQLKHPPPGRIAPLPAAAPARWGGLHLRQGLSAGAAGKTRTNTLFFLTQNTAKSSNYTVVKQPFKTFCWTTCELQHCYRWNGIQRWGLKPYKLSIWKCLFINVVSPCVFCVIVKVNKQSLRSSFEFFWKSWYSLCSNLFSPLRTKSLPKYV